MRSLTELRSAVNHQYGRVVYRLGVAAYRHERLPLAEALLRQHLRATRQFDIIAERATTGCPNLADYPSFERAFATLLDRQAQAWDENRIPLPLFLRDRARPADPAILAGRSVLVVSPRYVMSSARYIENDFADHFTESLRNAGVDAGQFFSDNIAYGDLFALDPAKAAKDLVTLREQIAKTKPQILVLEANFVGVGIGLTVAYLNEIKAAFGTKIVAILGDAWGEYGARAAEYWAPACDVIFHFAPAGDAERKTSFPEKLLCSAVPVNEQNFYPQEERSYDISFFGSYGTYLRPFWFACAKRISKRLGLKTNIRTHQRTADCPPMREYAAVMRASRVVMNCSSRSPGLRIMTGRVWQALHSGVVLLEEDDEPTKYFFIPFVHYVPFENARQLGHLIEFFKKNEAWVDRIGVAAADFCRRYYSSGEIWARVFETL